MTQKRKAYAPFSLTSEAGVGQTPVEGYIDVNQMIYPSVDTGVIDETGQWQGVKASDKEFIAFTKDEVVPNSGEILTPSTNPDGTWPLDMTGFRKLFIAIKPTRTGDYTIKAIMGPDSVRFANLSPVNAAATLRGSNPSATGNTLSNLFSAAAESLTADVWNIFIIGATNDELISQKLLQFSITNNSGGNSDIECAFMRIV
jgi:hypothetical protein